MIARFRAVGGVLAGVLLVLAGCGDGATDTAAPESPNGPTEAVAPQDSPAELQDGRHPGYVAAIDIAGRTVTVDIIEFLTGEEAVDAYAEDHPDDPGGPPNDYYIRNVNPRLRTLDVAPDVAVSVIWLGAGGTDTETIAFDELPGYFATNPEPGGGYEWWAPFWFTVRGGQVTGMDEQYIP